MKLRHEWSVTFERQTNGADGWTVDIEAVGRDYEGNAALVKIGDGVRDAGEFDLIEVWWLWRRIPVVLVIGMYAWAVEVVRARLVRLRRRVVGR